MPRSLRLFAFLLLLLALALPVSAADTFQLTLLHTNDLHGMMQPFDYQTDQSVFQGKHPDAGGMARRATLIKQIRRETHHPVMVVDTGDVFADGPWAAQWFGVPEIEAMNAMQYDALGVGNNEFQATFDAEAQGKMLRLLRRSRFPWLAANLTVGDTGVPVEGIRPFVVRTFGDVRVGFIGLVPSRVATYKYLVGWKIESPLQAAQQWVPVARQECDILIALVHLGEEEAKTVFGAVSGVDAIIAGDDHVFLAPPIMVKNSEGKEIPMVEGGERGVVLGRFDLTFTHEAGGWHLTQAEETLLPITDALPEDREVQRLLDRYLTPKPDKIPTLQPALAP